MLCYFNFPHVLEWYLQSLALGAAPSENQHFNGIQAASRIMKISLLSMSGKAAKRRVEQLAVATLLSSAKTNLDHI